MPELSGPGYGRPRLPQALRLAISLPAFTRSEPRVVRLQLERFVSDASPEQIRAGDQSIPWLQRKCRELEVRDTAAHEYTAILEYELPRDSRRPDVIVLERGAALQAGRPEHVIRACGAA